MEKKTVEQPTEKKLSDVEELDQTICLTWKMVPKEGAVPCPDCGEIHEHEQIQATAYIDCSTDGAIEAIEHLMQHDSRFAYIIKEAAKNHRSRQKSEIPLELLYLLSKLNRHS